MANKKLSNELKNTSYELFIGALSILSVFNIFFAFLVKDPDVSTVLSIMNAILTSIFIVDFLFRFLTTTSRKHYMIHEFGWADLLASMPFPQVKIFRLFRVFRVYRLMKKYGMHGIIRELLTNRGSGALLTIFFLTICVLQFGSIMILAAEASSPDAKITTASDAIWWIMETITTVGYGDVYPVTNEGRMVGVLVMVIGIGLFSTIAGFLANAFVSPKKK